MIDQYSRYPEVKFTTTFKATRMKLKKIFATHGVPKALQSNNGSPFNSHAFSDFARESGFQHKRITPRHTKAQGQVESFNKLVYKIMMIARHNSTKPDEAIYDMFQAYCSTPHPATKLPPYQLLMNREVRTKMDHFPTETHQNDREVRENDSRYNRRVNIYLLLP